MRGQIYALLETSSDSDTKSSKNEKNHTLIKGREKRFCVTNSNQGRSLRSL